MEEDRLFFSIFRNKYLRSEITKHLIIYKEVSNFTKNKLNCLNEESIKLFKYKEYILEMRYSSKSIIENNSNLFFKKEENNDKIEIIIDESIPISPESIPRSVKRLHLNSNQLLVKNSIPNSVKTLIITSLFKRDFIEGILPNSIESIIFNGLYSKTIYCNSLPKSLKNLKLKTSKNNQLVLEIGSLPESLETLHFKSGFNSIIPIGLLPSKSLVYLDFGDDFNRRIEKGVLPTSLRVLKFGKSFSKSIDQYVLPFGLEYIKFGCNWNEKFKINTFPESLKVLIFGESFNQFIEYNTLPKSIEYLKFKSDFDQSFNFSNLLNLKSIVLGWNFNKELNEFSFPKDGLLQFISFGKSFSKTINPIVLSNIKNLNSLYITSASLSSNTIIENSIPCTIKYLRFEIGFYYFTQIPNNIIPWSIEYLDLGFKFNSDLKKQYFNLNNTNQSNLRVLVFGDEFNKSLESQYLPSNLLSLKFGHSFNQLISLSRNNIIPSSLLKIEFGTSFNQPLIDLKYTNIKYIVIKNTKYSHFNTIPKNIKIIKNNDNIKLLSDKLILNQYENIKFKPSSLFFSNLK